MSEKVALNAEDPRARRTYRAPVDRDRAADLARSVKSCLENGDRPSSEKVYAAARVIDALIETLAASEQRIAELEARLETACAMIAASSRQGGIAWTRVAELEAALGRVKAMADRYDPGPHVEGPWWREQLRAALAVPVASEETKNA